MLYRLEGNNYQDSRFYYKNNNFYDNNNNPFFR